MCPESEPDQGERKCPRCGKKVDADGIECPFCRVEDKEPSLSEDANQILLGWERDLSFLLWKVRIRSYSLGGFAEVRRRLEGHPAAIRYTRGYWVGVNVIIIMLFSSAAAVLLLANLMAEGIPGVSLAALILGTVASVHAVTFYYITYVPPRK